ncbi:MAG: peptide ABC transporter substrate-binding protein [Candidatus Tyrphobacter sp.]
MRSISQAIRLAQALLLGCLVTSCGAPPQSPAGTVRFDLAADPTTLDPLFMHADAATVELEVDRLMFEPFIDLDPSGRPVPELLAQIPSKENGGLSADGRTITYHLRPGVRWSDGVPVTSADVLFTLHAILDPRNPVRSHEGYDLIDRAWARNAHTVVFHLRRAWAPAVMTYFSYGFSPQFVLPAHVLRDEAPLEQAPFGSAPSVVDGPYAFVSWLRGDRIELMANPRYWRGRPRVARLDIRIVADPNTNLVLLRSGQIDFNLLAPVQWEIVRNVPDLRFVRVPTAVVAGISINTSHPPLDDVRVRRAIAMSIDRAGITRRITLGNYVVTNAIQPQFSWAFDPRVAQPRYDPRAADALFDAAGWRRGRDGMRARDGKPLSLVYVAFPETASGVRIADEIAEELHLRGVAVEIKSISNAQLFLPVTGTLAMGNYDLAYVPWTMGSDPDDSSVLTCGAPANYMRWCDRRVDALESQALGATSQTQRKALYARIERIVAQQVPILYLFNARYIYAYRSRLLNFHPNAFVPTWNAYDWSLEPGKSPSAPRLRPSLR